MKYFVSAGEASGDLHAAGLIRELRANDPDADFRFLGGDLMADAAGVEPEIHYRDMAYMGFSEVLRHLPEIFGNFKRAKKAIDAFRPDALVLIDYPSFNLKLASYAFDKGIPVYYYIAPKVWAWKEWRVKQLRRLIRRIYCILPFEKEYFASHGIDAIYVGNPSVEEIEARLEALPPYSEFAARHGIDTSKPLLTLVPGSRIGEIRNNLPIMALTASHHPSLTPVIAGAPAIPPSLYSGITSLPVITGHTSELMKYASAALVTSGTATLECALAATPQVACYRANGSRLSYNIMKKLIKSPFVTLPNLIAGKEIIPEMLVHLCTVDSVDSRLSDILPGSQGRQAQLDGYSEMRSRLGHSPAAATAANDLIQSLTNGHS